MTIPVAGIEYEWDEIVKIQVQKRNSCQFRNRLFAPDNQRNNDRSVRNGCPPKQ